MAAAETVEDTCQFAVGEEEEGEATESTFSLTLSDEGFSILGDGEGAEAVSCTLDNKNFTCDSLTGTLADEATFTITATTAYDGSFTSETELTVNTATELICEGADCPVVEEQIGASLPCSISATATATISE